MNLILYGFKGAGKTYFAKKIGLPYIDIDTLLGLEPREIVLRKGEKYFREIEEKWIANLEVKNHVISVGAGAILNPNNLKKLKTLGKLIYLKCPKEILKKRNLTLPLPTYFDQCAPEASFEKIYSQRIPKYEKLADVTIDVTDEEEALKNLWQVINSENSSVSPPGESRTAKPLEL